MAANPSPLTGRTTIAAWLSSRIGGPLLRSLLDKDDVAQASLRPVLQLSLESLAEVSRGRITKDDVDHLVRAANDGELVIEDEPEFSGSRFVGKTIVVTGAASGIGRATARRILAEGGCVVAVDLTEDGLSALTAERSGGQVLPVIADVTSDEDIEKILDAVKGEVDGLANIAGITDGHRPLHETGDDLWSKVMAVNVDGPFRLMRAIVPRMIADGGGAIVNVASEASLRGNAAGTAYTVSKHAIVGLTRSAAFLYAPQGIRVNAVAPGPVATGIEGAFASEFSESRIGPFMGMIPPVADAASLASSITWMLCEDSRNINGAVLPSDGGWSVQ